MGRLLVVAVLLLSLSGCVTTVAPAGGLSADERSAIQQFSIDRQWQYLGLPDAERPPQPAVVVVSRDQYGAALVNCMNNAGFDNYRVNSKGIVSISIDEDQTSDELVQNYLCRAGLWADGDEGWYNDAELGYIYDYFETVLVPCMATLGAQVDDAPPRAEFLAEHGGWHPYLYVDEDDQARFFGDRSVLATCPAVPPGVADPGLDSLWDQQ